MNKIMAFLSLFRKGEQLANSAAWKNRQITGTMVGVFLVALVQVANAFGVSIPLDEGTAVAIGGGVIGIWNVLLTVLTSKKAGLSTAVSGGQLPVEEQASDAVQQVAHAEAQPDTSEQPLPPVSGTHVANAEPTAADIAEYIKAAHAALAADRGRRTEDASYYGN